MYQLLSDKYDYGFRSHQGCILHVAANKNGIAFSSRDFFSWVYELVPFIDMELLEDGNRITL